MGVRIVTLRLSYALYGAFHSSTFDATAGSKDKQNYAPLTPHKLCLCHVMCAYLGVVHALVQGGARVPAATLRKGIHPRMLG